MFSYLVYCIRPFIQEKPMSERKNSKSRRNYLVKCSCPNCTQESEHSFSRVQKGALLIYPHCNKVFQTNLKAVAWLILLVTSIFYILIIYLKQIIKNPPERVWDCGAFCGSHPLTHFVLPCQQLASAVKLFMQQTCTSPQWLAYFSWLRFCQICWPLFHVLDLLNFY